MRFTRSEIAGAVNGRLVGPDGSVESVSIDSRSMAASSLFVPVVAERDGHQFIEAALANGATCWFTQHPNEVDGEIVVADTTLALQQLGRYARQRLGNGVIGITGSAGKTSTKDLIAAILQKRGAAAASEKSFNNELGVPLTLVNAPDEAWSAIIEMGARGVGHIAMLCELATPNVGVITNIGTAHRELFETAEQTAHAKAELFEALPSDGIAVANLDDSHFETVCAHAKCQVRSFSASGNSSATFFATNIESDNELRHQFDMHTPEGVVHVGLHVRGRHQVANALAAALATWSVGATFEEIVSGLTVDTISPWRMELSELANGALVLNDSYNANPSSMAVAIDALAGLPAERRIAVLGTMAELGAEKKEMHQEVARRTVEQNVQIVLAISEADYGVPVFGSIDEVLEALAKIGAPRSGDAILVKGSRVAGLEKLADRLKAL